MYTRLCQIIKGRLWQKHSAIPEPRIPIKLIDSDLVEIWAEVINMPGAIVHDGKLFVYDHSNLYRQSTVEDLKDIELETILRDAAKARHTSVSVQYSDYADDRSDILDQLSVNNTKQEL